MSAGSGARDAAVRSALAGAVGVVGIGIDAVELARFAGVLARTPTFVDRIFTADERAYAERRRDPTERFAARFAAKEATLKALGVGIGACGFREIEVRRDDEGAPSLVLHGTAAELAAGRGVTRLALTITHTDVHAEAVVVAFADRPAPANDVGSAGGGPGAATGVVRVRAHDPEASVAFYRDLLGFAPDPHPADGVARLVRGQVVVEVVGPVPSPVGRGGAGPVVELHLEVDDADPIREASGGVAGDDGAFVVVDPDGVVVRVTERST
ncbi:MAG: holo-ACP synthase [Acidimicrobiales bacterium]